MHYIIMIFPLLSWCLCGVQAGEADREAAEAQFKLVGEANSVLSDPQQRARYDASVDGVLATWKDAVGKA